MAVDVIDAPASSLDFSITSQQVTFAATPSNGELIMLIHHTTTDAITVTATGFTSLGVFAGSSNLPRCTILYRVASSEGSATYTASFSGTVNNSGLVGLRITGASTSDPFDIDPTSTAAFGDIVCPTITTTAANSMHLCIGAAADTVTDSTPSGYTQERSAATNRCGVYSKIIASAGATGTQNIGSDNENVAISLAVAIAGAAATSATARRRSYPRHLMRRTR